MVRMLLEHNPRDRPSSKELISKYLPVKMEEADFANVHACSFCSVQVHVCVCACVRACVCVCARACV